jgi:hypothetical protein
MPHSSAAARSLSHTIIAQAALAPLGRCSEAAAATPPTCSAAMRAISGVILSPPGRLPIIASSCSGGMLLIMLAAALSMPGFSCIACAGKAGAAAACRLLAQRAPRREGDGLLRLADGLLRLG